MEPFGFVGEHYKDYSLTVGVEETRNLYPALVASPTARKRIVLQNVPGLEEVYDLRGLDPIAPETPQEVVAAGHPGGPIRGLFYQDGVLWVVAGPKLYSFSVAWDSVDRNPSLPLVNDGALVDIVSNGRQGHQILIRSAYAGYIYDTEAGTLTLITDPNFPANCRRVVFIDGYFAALDSDSGRVCLSDLYDGLAWDGSAVAIRSSTSDKVVDIAEAGELWFFGTKTSDAWHNTGASVFPFAPVPGSRMLRGLRSPATFVRIGGGFCFVGTGENGGAAVFKTQGFNAIQVSTPAVEYRMSAGVDDAEAYGYDEAGHSFYVLRIPGQQTCMVYDFTTNLWHERNKWNTTRGQWEAHVGRCHAWAFDEHIIGDVDGRLYRQSLDLYDFAGSPRRWLRRAPHVGDGSISTFHQRLMIDMEVGVGLTTGEGFDPQAMLRYSDNFGKTWSHERWAPIGRRGNYGNQVEWRRLGRATGGRVYEVSGASAVKTVIADALLDATPGRF